MIDISVLGQKELEKNLKKLENAAQKTIVRSALRKSAKRIQRHLVANLDGQKVNVRSGNLRDAFKRTKVRGSTRNGFIRVGIVFPERDDLGIAPDEEGYYPTAVEYGHGSVPAYPYMRPAVDENDAFEKLQIGKDIGQGIERRLAKL